MEDPLNPVKPDLGQRLLAATNATEGMPGFESIPPPPDFPTQQGQPQEPSPTAFDGEEMGEEESLAVQYALAIPRGVEGMLQGVYKFTDFLSFDALPDWEKRVLGTSTHWSASLLEGVATYAIPGVAAVKLFGVAHKGAGFAAAMSRLGRGAMAGAVVDAIITDPDGARLSDWAKEAGVDWAVTNYLASDEKDTEAEARLKNALEGIVPGVALDLIGEVFRGVRGSLRGKKTVEPKHTNAANKALKSMFQDEFGLDHDELVVVDAFMDAAGLDRSKIRPASELGDGALLQGGRISEMDMGEVVEAVRPFISRWQGWFREGNRAIKPNMIKALEAQPRVQEAAYSVFYDQWKAFSGNKDASFQQFLDSPITVYRAGRADPSAPFVSYSLDKDMAVRHRDTGIGGGGPRGGEIEELVVTPRDTYGMFQTTAELEVLVKGKTLAQGAPKTDTPEFREWFKGASAEVEASPGVPKVLYHYTDSQFSSLPRKLRDARRELISLVDERRKLDDLPGETGAHGKASRSAEKTTLDEKIQRQRKVIHNAVFEARRSLPEFESTFAGKSVLDQDNLDSLTDAELDSLSPDAFNPRLSGATDSGWLGTGSYFSDKRGGFFGKSSQEYEVFVNMRNPFIMGETPWPEGVARVNPRLHPAKHTEALKEAGFDGLIARGKHSTMDGDAEYVVFDKSQIKSKDNTGPFGQRTPSSGEASSAGLSVEQAARVQGQGDIRFQGADASDGARAFVRFQEDGTAYIGALKNPDVTSALHELSHVVRRQLFSDEGIAARIGLDAADVNKAAEWAGATRKGNAWDWGTAAEEKFASGFERYLRDGIAPNEGLRGFFEKMATYFRRTYQQIRNTALDVEVSPEMKRIFDKVIQRDEALAKSGISVRATSAIGGDSVSLVVRKDTPIGKSEIFVHSKKTDLRVVNESLDPPEFGLVADAPLKGSIEDRVRKAAAKTSFLYRGLVDSEKILAVPKGQKPTAEQLVGMVAWVEDGSGAFHVVGDVDVTRLGASNVPFESVVDARPQGVREALAKDDDVLFQAARREEGGRPPRREGDAPATGNARYDENLPDEPLNIDRIAGPEDARRVFYAALDSPERLPELPAESLATTQAYAIDAAADLMEMTGDEMPPDLVSRLLEGSADAIREHSNRLQTARELSARYARSLAADIAAKASPDGSLSSLSDDDLLDLLRGHQGLEVVADEVRRVMHRIGQALGANRIRFGGALDDSGAFAPPRPSAAVEPRAASGANPGVGVGRGGDGAAGAGAGPGRGPGAGPGAGGGPGRGPGAGPGAGGGPGRGPGAGPGAGGGPGRGPGAGPASPPPRANRPRSTTEAFIKANGGRKSIERRLRQFRALTEANPTGLPKMQKKKGWMAMLPEYFINSILSGPITHAVNVTSGIFQTVTRPLEMGFGSLITGQGRQAASEVSELAWHFHQSIEAIKLAGISMKKDASLLIAEGGTIREGSNLKAIGAAAQGVGKDTLVGKVLDRVGKITNIPSRFLMTEDEFFKQLNYRAKMMRKLHEVSLTKFREPEARAEWMHKMLNAAGEEGQFYGMKNLSERGNVLAKQNGLDGEAAKEFTAKYVSEMWDSDVQKIAVDARQRAREATFTEGFGTKRGDGGITKKTLGFSVRDSVSGMSAKLATMTEAHPSLRLVFPFIRTPVNILQWFNDRTLGAVSDLMGTIASKEAKAAFTGEAAADLAGRFSTGVALVTAAAHYATLKDENGLPRLTGAGPSDPGERKAWEATGWRPYSVRMGDKYVSYRRVDPAATFFGIVADLVQEQSYSEMLNREPEWGNALMVAVTNNLVSKTYMLGAINLARAMGEPERFAGQLIEQFAGAAAPASAFVSQAVNPMRGDDLLHDIRGAGEAFRAKFILSDPKKIPLRRNVLGEAIEKDRGAPFGDSFSPFRYVEVKDDAISNEMVRSGAGISPPRKTANNVDWTTYKNEDGVAAYDRWMELHGTVEIGGLSLRDRLTRLIESKRYQRLPQSGVDDIDSPRVAALQRIVGRYREKARRQVFEEYPDLASDARKVLSAKSLLRRGQAVEHSQLPQRR